MIPTLSLVLFSLQTAASAPLVRVNAPDPRVGQMFERARQELLQNPIDENPLPWLARTAIGVPAPHASERMSLLALNSLWNATADTLTVRQRWPDLRASFSTAASDTAQDTGLWLATLDATIAIARSQNDLETDSAARRLYPRAEARLAQTISLYGLAFGLYEDSLADPLLTKLPAQVHAIWPIGNGLAALAFYAYHRDSTAFAIVDSMMHRGGSAPAMVILPFIRGLIGWETDAPHRAAALEPHLPSSWNSLTISNLAVGTDRIDAAIRRDRNTYSIHLQRHVAGKQLSLRIAPALPAGSKVRNVTVNERDVPVHIEDNKHDVHVVIEIPFLREAQIDIEFDPPAPKAPSIR